ncbi:P-loop containing nucleoside triphosphate hydrolase protein [Dichotomopilus funicola]|uniref:P-loop containing nucleoside triphosphate hydrolase protein n=1 Tax=Dichotomopilus funicola TaxID=1934379 RepID=A0AAN6V3N7_9PEZI|nr:P-loop containing nucleoside triphosphate hydrolase protein [Dichotomopilus funicola]
MSNKPILVATHPRACSTAFERVFMTRTDVLHCVHEPFGDAFYFGPERLSGRYENDGQARQESGFANTTYRDVLDGLLNPANSDGKRLFIKDIAHYLLPPHQQPVSIAPSLASNEAKQSASAPQSQRANPTVLPASALREFHFTFLIRHPRRAIPSYYRCTVPPLSTRTGFHKFMPSEAGYDELRRLFDYLLHEGLIQPKSGETANGVNGTGSSALKVTVVDADDLLDKPAEVVEAFCADIGLDYHDGMLKWGDEESQQRAIAAFAKWDGFHDDAIASTELRARVHAKKTPTEKQEDEEWRNKFGEEGQKIIRECVNANVADYEYLKSFAIKV